MQITDTLTESLRRLGSSRSDEFAWKFLLKTFWPLLFAASFRILRGHRELAEDATQEALFKLFKYGKFEDFVDQPQAFYSYVLAVGRNVSLGYLIELKRWQDLDDSGNASIEKDPIAKNPETNVVWNELLARSILKISEDDRKLLNLLLKGYSTQEIAQDFGIKYSTALVRIHRLRSKLAKLLETK